MDYRTGEFREVFGDHPGREDYECVCPANVDLICSNIFMGEKENQIIDYEWMFDFPVPVNFIMWRLIHELYTHVSELPRLCHEDEMMAEFDISYTDYEIFMDWTMHFVYEYVGCGSLIPFEQKKVPVSVTELVNREREKHQMHSKLYYDLGEGFCEEHTLYAEGKLSGNRFRVEFALSGIKGIRNLRWNPANGHFLKVRIERLDCGCSAELVPQGVHMKVDNSTTAFFTTDGFYLIDVTHPENVDRIVIEGKLDCLELPDVEKLLAFEKEREVRREQERVRKEAERAAKQAAEEAARAQEEALRHPGKKAQVKRLVKKVLRYHTEPAAVMGVETTPTCMGSVDFFHYENGTLNAIGWAFDPTFASMGQPRIAFYQGTQKLQEASCTTIYVRMWLMPLEIRMRKVPDFLSWQRFLRRQRLLFSWNTEPQRIPEDSLSERSREPGIRKSFWYTRSKIRRVSEISVISNSVIYAVRERHIHRQSISRRWM